MKFTLHTPGILFLWNKETRAVRPCHHVLA